MSKTPLKLSALIVGMALALSGCAASGGEATGKLQSLGDNEATLSLLGWPGYAEDGSNDPAYDWVTPFEEASGCQVTF
jgi:putative spermidine/putrescine transport system substrate-binding protein